MTADVQLLCGTPRSFTSPSLRWEALKCFPKPLRRVTERVRGGSGIISGAYSSPRAPRDQRRLRNRLDDEHAVEAGVDQPIRDSGLDRENPQSLARSEQHALLDAQSATAVTNTAGSCGSPSGNTST